MSPVEAGRTWTLLGPDGGPYASGTPGTRGGHRGTRIFGRLDCPAALRAIARGGYVRSRVFFADGADARAAGYRPCAVCSRAEYDAWRAEAGSRHAVRRSSHTREGAPISATTSPAGTSPPILTTL